MPKRGADDGLMLAAQKIKVDGSAPTFAAPSLSDTVRVGSTLVVKNDSVGSINVTLVVPGNLETGVGYPDKVYAVGAGDEAWIPVLAVYGQDDSPGVADVTFSAVTSVTVASIVHA
jgi:hypothetical protein